MANKQEKPKKPGRRVEASPPPKSGQPVTAALSENWKKWSQLVAQAWADEKFKQRLMDNPGEVLQGYGIEVPAGVEVRVVESTDKVSYLTLPRKPVGDVTELTSSQLSGVAGGRDSDCVVIGPGTITPLCNTCSCFTTDNCIFCRCVPGGCVCDCSRV